LNHGIIFEKWSGMMGNKRFVWKGWQFYPLDFTVLAGIAILLIWSNFSGRDNDIHLYAQYVSDFFSSRKLPVEYPPLAIIVFCFTRFPFPNIDPYLQFNCWMVVIILISYLIVLQHTTRKLALYCALFICLGGTPMVLRRYDIVPALFTLFAFFAVRSHRYALSYSLLAIGTMLKVYPAFCFPIVLVSQWQQYAGSLSSIVPLRQRLLAVARHMLPGLSVAGGIIFSVLLVAISFSGLSGAFSFLMYASQRPTQVESVGGSLIWLQSVMSNVSAPISFSYGSENWDNGASIFIARISIYLLVLGAIIICVALLHRRLSISAAFLAMIGMILLTNKVFSPQYILWIVPFVAEVEGVDPVWIAICVLTAIDVQIYPWRRASPPDVTGYFIEVAIRNGLLLFAIVRIFYHFRTQPDRVT
jgi:hypothetical protein